MTNAENNDLSVDAHDQPAQDERVERAYEIWKSRQSRDSHPLGGFDDKSRWYPSSRESRACCASIRQPSAAFPYSLLTHCRSVAHIAALTDVPLGPLRSRIARDRPAAQRHGGEHYYKAVAVVEGRYLSIFDGVTEYKLNQQVEDRARRGHGGGIYVYPTLEDALDARVPGGSALLAAPRVILRVRAEGKSCIYDNGKLAFSRVTPLEVVA